MVPELHQLNSFCFGELNKLINCKKKKTLQTIDADIPGTVMKIDGKKKKTPRGQQLNNVPMKG